ncbi:hypothetical protein LC55x_5249 [Lysobacter capsici]|nr:hypothetical protein LC55x_5249 [Lysobacter capsici]
MNAFAEKSTEQPPASPLDTPDVALCEFLSAHHRSPSAANSNSATRAWIAPRRAR